MRKIIRYIAALALTLTAGSTVHAETYLCIQDIPGDVSVEGYEDCIQVIGFAERLNVEPPPPGGGSPIREFGPIRVVKRIDRATPLLSISAATGEILGPILGQGVTLSFVRQCDEALVKYYEVRLLNGVVVTSVSATAGEDIPTEQVSLSFNKIQWAYTPINDDCSPDAEITRGWNLETNAEF